MQDTKESSSAAQVAPVAGEHYLSDSELEKTLEVSRPSSRHQTALESEIDDVEKKDETAVAPAGVVEEKQPAGPAPAGVDEDIDYIQGWKLFAVMAGTTLVIFLMLLDSSIVSTAVPRITDEFHSLPDVGWYASSYQLASAALQPLTGKIYTHFSTKWSFLGFFILFEIGSALCGAATSSVMLIVGRSVAGMGTSGLMNGGLTIIAGSVPLSKRPALMGVLMGFSQLGVVLGPLLGGAFTEYATWRWNFYINLPIGALVAILLIFIHIPDQTPKPAFRSAIKQLPHYLDLIGFVLLAPSAIMLLLALQYGGNSFPWTSSEVIGLFVGSGATFIVWFVWNWRQGDDALIPFSMAKKTIVWSSALSQTSLFTTLFLSAYFIPIYFQAVRDTSPMLSGVYLMPTILSQLIAAVVSGILVSKLGYVMPFGIFAGVLTAIGTGLYSRFQPDTPSREWIGFQLITGFGRGSGMQMGLVALQSAVKPSEISLGMSFLVFSQFLGTAIFLTLANVIFGESLKHEIPIEAPNVNPYAVIAAGATHFRSIVKPEDLPGVLVAYSNSLDHVFYLGAATGVCIFLSAFGLGWVDIRQKKPKAPTDA